VIPIEILGIEFYERDTETVSKKLLGKRLIKRLSDTFLEGIIVETEAYYGIDDPASRAYHGVKNYNKPMWGEPGRVFIYNVHNNWMFNVVAHKPNQVGAVLIRAVQPTRGVNLMEKNRKVENPLDLTNGPGKLTKAFGIDKSLMGILVASLRNEVFIANGKMELEIGNSHRIGVRKDLSRNLRFFIKGNNFVSK
jgi:DNA-3-methyladenine glycosylase